VLRGNLKGILITLEGVVSSLLAVVAGGELGEVTVVVTDHLVIEDLGLRGGSLGDEVVLEDLDDIGADVCQLLLNLLPVGNNLSDVLLVAFGLLQKKKKKKKKEKKKKRKKEKKKRKEKS